MQFNSVAFLVFLPTVFLVYWALQGRPLRLQNCFLLLASYIFYAWWDWRFLSLLVFSSALDYTVARAVEHSEGKRRTWLLVVSLAGNLGVLGLFKYYGFFVHSVVRAFEIVGLHIHASTLSLILPLGISFYTFRTISYAVDVYRRKIPAARDPIAYFAYVSFFPELVAGPIDRAEHLLPQFLHRRTFDYASARDGMQQILWGFFKKCAVADRLAPVVDDIFRNYPVYQGPTLLLGILYFSIQIYCDFSAYSDIAIGVGRLFGFDLMRNFAFPYFSRSPREFWKRWHISLSTWFRDYVYIPLGGSRTKSRLRHAANLLATFALSGLWHGASWNFIFWGLYNGALLVPGALLGRSPAPAAPSTQHRVLPGIVALAQMAGTFGLVSLGWLFFRSASLRDALQYLARMFATSWAVRPPHLRWGLLAALVLGLEWVQRRKQHALQIEGGPAWVRWAV